eukprot:CAMPEP_0172518922 /NCGR_PEP_ID=MMETSP1066-20121228/291107_1 /TAXON_ID=671091 /ORGANISM="Coscinodiscus wailesii, Strain CCMP2513" /LENGTH=283 /DNA_ID=CAMNT_0013301405 /DNA_START=217 /DNA_END=1068 /DNA_ORIENTATION=-
MGSGRGIVTVWSGGKDIVRRQRRVSNNRIEESALIDAWTILPGAQLDLLSHCWKSVPSSHNNYKFSAPLQSSPVSNTHYETMVTVSRSGRVILHHVNHWTWNISSLSRHDNDLCEIHNLMERLQPSCEKVVQFLHLKQVNAAGHDEETKRRLRLCEWRLGLLLSSCGLVPPPRRLLEDDGLCHAAVRVGEQFYLFTGGDDDDDIGSDGNGRSVKYRRCNVNGSVLLILHLELPGECERRMNEDRYARLEQERRRREKEQKQIQDQIASAKLKQKLYRESVNGA